MGGGKGDRKALLAVGIWFAVVGGSLPRHALAVEPLPNRPWTSGRQLSFCRGGAFGDGRQLPRQTNVSHIN